MCVEHLYCPKLRTRCFGGRRDLNGLGAFLGEMHSRRMSGREIGSMGIGCDFGARMMRIRSRVGRRRIVGSTGSCRVCLVVDTRGS